MGTSTSKESPTSKDQPPGKTHGFAHTTALPPPYQLAIEDTSFRMTILDGHAARNYDCDCALLPSTWFSVSLAASTRKRYLYLVQKETGTGLIVLVMLFDRAPTSEDSSGLRLPSSGAWLRAVVDGVVYVLASDLVLNRKAITAWIGGHEPSTMAPAHPPCT
jgi:hypothetical protein